jgi:hypothetical protein
MIRFIGCGRSGTKYTAEVMQKIGMDIKHELTGKDGTASCYAMSPPPYLQTIGDFIVHENEDCSKTKWDYTIHQVRDPLKQIESAYVVFFTNHWEWFENHYGYSKKINRLQRCMTYWYVLNKHCQSLADYTFRIEDIDNEWETILNKINIPITPIPELKKTINREQRNKIPFKKEIKIDWSVLYNQDIVLAKRIKTLAESYGYKY